jgi:four helix bundle protein
MQPYERFEAWQRSHLLALAVYRITADWPASERFGLVAQLRRAALAVPTNIAEGSAKRGRAEFGRFLDIAVGSLAEVGYLLRFARDAGLLRPSDWQRVEPQWADASRMLWLLYRAIRRAGAPRS